MPAYMQLAPLHTNILCLAFLVFSQEMSVVKELAYGLHYTLKFMKVKPFFAPLPK